MLGLSVTTYLTKQDGVMLVLVSSLNSQKRNEQSHPGCSSNLPPTAAVASAIGQDPEIFLRAMIPYKLYEAPANRITVVEYSSRISGGVFRYSMKNAGSKNFLNQHSYRTE